YRIFTKGPNEAKNDKTEHGIGKSVKKSKSKSTKVKVKDEAENEEFLNGPTRTQINRPGQPIKL
ncbi:hypothetical protein Tco_0827895, partial [Tanacetum coccineum]